MKFTRARKAAFAAGAALALALTGCAGDTDVSKGESGDAATGGSIAEDYDLSGNSFIVGSKEFTENKILGQIAIAAIQAAGGDDEVASAQYPFWVSSSLCILSAGLAIFCLPHIGQDTIQLVDTRFLAYLEANGYDTRQLGMNKGDVFESTDAEIPTEGLAETAKGEKTAA